MPFTLETLNEKTSHCVTMVWANHRAENPAQLCGIEQQPRLNFYYEEHSENAPWEVECAKG